MEGAQHPYNPRGPRVHGLQEAQSHSPAGPPEALLPRMSPRPAAHERVVTCGRPIRARDQNSPYKFLRGPGCRRRAARWVGLRAQVAGGAGRGRKGRALRTCFRPT